jgi:aarF domain-containing kinase
LLSSTSREVKHPTHALEFTCIFLFCLREQYWLELVTSTLEMAGPTFVKLGQWASTRPDIFHPDSCFALSRLHHDVHHIPFDDAKRVVELAFNAKLSDIFSEFQREPIGSGCVAQAR